MSTADTTWAIDHNVRRYAAVQNAMARATTAGTARWDASLGMHVTDDEATMKAARRLGARIHPVEWATRMMERRQNMEAIGFPEGSRVRALRDANPKIPAGARFAAGDTGTVVLNLAHGPEVISVRWETTESQTVHALAPADLEPA